MSKITLEDFLNAQTSFMHILGIDFEDPSSLQQAVVGTVAEASEMMENAFKIPKPWKEVSKDWENKKKADLLEESIDVLFFLLEVWSLAGLEEEDIRLIYSGKYTTNLCRILASMDPNDWQPYFINLVAVGEPPKMKVDKRVKAICDKVVVALNITHHDDMTNFLSDPVSYSRKPLERILWNKTLQLS